MCESGHEAAATACVSLPAQRENSYNRQIRTTFHEGKSKYQKIMMIFCHKFVNFFCHNFFFNIARLQHCCHISISDSPGYGQLVVVVDLIKVIVMFFFSRGA